LQVYIGATECFRCQFQPRFYIAWINLGIEYKVVVAEADQVIVRVDYIKTTSVYPGAAGD